MQTKTPEVIWSYQSVLLNLFIPIRVEFWCFCVHKLNSRPLNSCSPVHSNVSNYCVWLMSITFSKDLPLSSCLLWKNQYYSSVSRPGNLWSVPLCLMPQLGNSLNLILNLRTALCQRRSISIYMV